jgi:hypothetical protein
MESMPNKNAVISARQEMPLTVRLRRQTAIISRWLHVYLSMVSFAIVLFFAVTGLTLNHAEWFASQQRSVQHNGVLPLEWLGTGRSDVDQLKIAERLRASEKLHGAVSDFRADDRQVTVSFKAPGYAADTFIDRGTGHYELTITTDGFVAVLNDLHKGRDSGRAWSWLIDASAILLTLVSFSGLLLLFFVYKRRLSGLILASAGGLACWLVWLRFVP